MKARQIGFATAISLVIANMVGTGVFTSLGFQVIDIKSTFAVLLLWVIGAVMALCGALVYGEIGAAFPESGGEYNYLSKLFHPLLGFLSGWVSSTVGFSAPVALASIAFGQYVYSVFPVAPPVFLAVFLLIIITSIHASDLKLGATFQRWATFLKVVFMLVFMIGGLLLENKQPVNLIPGYSDWKEVLTNGAFAVSLFWVSYAYAGWNAAAYMAGEIKEPQKNLPRSLILGTVVVALIYILLNYVFLLSCPLSELAGQIEIGHIAASHIFGEGVGKVMGIIISLLLVSSISSMIMVGPRVMAAFGENMKPLKFLAKRNKRGVPHIAVITQSLISLLLILTAKFNEVLELIGFILSLSSTLTVAGIFVLRTRFRNLNSPFRIKFYPFVPILFLLINGWILYYGFTSRLSSSLYSLLILAAGAIVWLLLNRINKNSKA